VNYLISGNATFEGAQAKLLPVLNRISVSVSTVTSSQTDNNDFFEKATRSSMKKSKSSFKKMGKVGKMMMIFIIVGVLIGVSYFVVKFFNRKIICEEGFYLSDLNQCVGCSEGCVRCEDSMPNKCMKCSVNMFLVLDD
jgi:beta-lactamase regulating signal transducer with metallopeptidase domain